MPNQILIMAPAKVNLVLDVIGKRPDGYHDLETVMHQVDLGDKVYVEKADRDIGLSADSRDIPMDSSNLAYQAAILMLNLFDIRGGLRIFLEKNIPVGAGLAGGSGNAAAVIMAVNQLYGLGLTNEELCMIGARVGSDVPFCNSGGTALARGRGEILSPLSEGPLMYLLLVKPPQSLSTAAVYQGYKTDSAGPRPSLNAFLNAWERCDMIDVAQLMCNVLESVSIPMVPEIRDIKDRALRMGALGAIMSGSGPTVVAAFASEKECVSAAANFRNQYREVYVVNSIRK